MDFHSSFRHDRIIFTNETLPYSHYRLAWFITFQIFPMGSSEKQGLSICDWVDDHLETRVAEKINAVTPELLRNVSHCDEVSLGLIFNNIHIFLLNFRDGYYHICVEFNVFSFCRLQNIWDIHILKKTSTLLFKFTTYEYDSYYVYIYSHHE